MRKRTHADLYAYICVCVLQLRQGSFEPCGDKALVLQFAALLGLHGGTRPGACGVRAQLGGLAGSLETSPYSCSHQPSLVWVLDF